MNVVRVLRAARKILEDRRRWTQNAYARDKFGSPVPAYAPEAKCFCALGAMRKVLGPEGDGMPVVRLLADAGKELGFTPIGSVVDVNDGPRRTSRTKVLAMYDRAIELAKAKAKEEKAAKANG